MKKLEYIDNTRFFERVTIAGNIITVKKYEHLNVGAGGAVNRPENGEGRDKEHNYQNTQKRRRENVRNLITTNFSSNDKFVTLTFRNGLDFDICNVQDCNKKFHLFIVRLKRYLAKEFPGRELKYLAVIEFQDARGRGAVHYHVLMNVPYIRKSVLSNIWDFGFIKINAIDKVTNIGAYVSKYMNKDLDDVRLMGENAFLHSRNLLRPIELANWRRSDDVALYEVHEWLDKKSPSYSAKYESENAGKIVYLQYNISEE